MMAGRSHHFYGARVHVMVPFAMNRAFRYRLYPTAEQARLLDETANVVRFVRNLALEQRRDFWRQAQRLGVRFNYVTQGHEVTKLRAEFDWIRAVSCVPITQALRDLDRAFANFYAGRADFPKFHSKYGTASFRHQARDLRFVELSPKWSLIYVPKIGLVKMRRSRDFSGEPVSATFIRDALGWHVSISCEQEHEAEPSSLPAVGIDRGVANTITLSTGEMLSTPCTAALERKKRKSQRVLSRRKKGSARYRKQRARLSRVAAKISRIRAHWRHETTTALARRFGLVSMEDLNTSAMTRAGTGKRYLNRAILDQGWRAFENILAYKLEERGGTLVKVNPAYTSQTCSDCGTVDRLSRESQARFACNHCGFEIHADHNAALNILRRSTASVEAAGCRADEARTHAVAA